MSKYFDKPFAISGDRVSIPEDTQGDGSVSYEEGYGPDYQADQGSVPAAKNLPRDTENGFKFDVTEALKEVQEYGVIVYRADINYPVSSLTIGSDETIYQCKIANGPLTTVVDPVGDLTGTWEAYTTPPAMQLRNFKTIVNGDFCFWPLGYSRVATGGANIYTAGNFVAHAGVGGVATISRENFVKGQTDVVGSPQHFLKFNQTVPAASGESFLENVVEFADTHSGETIVLNMYARSAAPVNISFRVIQNFGAGGDPEVVTTAAASISPTSTFQLYSISIDVPSVLGKDFGTQGTDFFRSGWFIDFSEGAFDLDVSRWWVGDDEAPEIPEEEHLLRSGFYFESTYADGVEPGTVTDDGIMMASVNDEGDSNGYTTGMCNFVYRKRSSPTISINSPLTGAAGQCNQFNEGDIACSAANVTRSRFTLQVVGANNNRDFSYHYAASSYFVY